MVRAPHAGSVASHDAVRPRLPGQTGGTSFTWSLAKIRIACLLLFATATAASAGITVSVPFEQWLCLAWLIGVALLMRRLDQRASTDAVVLSVDPRGIFDRRLMERHIAWQEIEAICPVNPERSHVVDIVLRWPRITLDKTRWSVRIGAYCQVGYGVPAVTINMVLLEGSVSEMLDAIARYRPDLLHCTNRGDARHGARITR